ncbi:hypothetical protein [Aliarcobacter butzleri]|uniref:hypothetical protein n=1 Tax=Aliarcobacter butzleri TaxID=28197 RepID=UPI001EDAF06B|nr:hypothetical protein [Aliarcobacter butzleri]MCG3710382.1 hypothetical protein [Aliarcobacter butzleri]MCG3716346.1 hypothetical protein [Aliarcobacter butzleri]MCT7549065.1 hypothetical protein [Aliarcobacter butzleri]MCT7558375.1 hypothetical protein [Aliarcobacter butzleri]MCT7610598.1 hypothetical protein [Aliarcobacter butzleri]
MGKIVLDEKEVNELMDTFDFSKSVYLQKLEKISKVIEKLDEIQTAQKEISDDLIQFKPILLKLQDKDEREVSLNYAAYLSFLGKKIDELSKSSSLKKLEFIVDNSNKIVKFATLKLGLIVAIGVIVILILNIYKT